jgi:F-type H+-transporting ATPase subunit b
MSRRGRRVLKVIAVLYLGAVIALLASIPYGRSQRTRPKLIRTEVTVPRQGHFEGWRAEARFEDARQEFVRAGYILRTAVRGAEGTEFEAGRVLAKEELAALAGAGVGKVYVFDPRLVRALAAQKVEVGEEIKDAYGNPIVRLGDELTEKKLVDIAIGFDLTLVFTGLNFLALAALLYAFLWGPITRLLDDRAKAIREDIETARSERDEAESLRTEVQGELADIREGARQMRDEGRAEGERDRARLVEDGREEAKRLVERAERAMQAGAEEARKQLVNELAGLSAGLAAKMLRREVTRADHERLTDEFVRSLEAGGDKQADGGAR